MNSSGDDVLTLDLGAWEGPLDLLLALARAQKVDLRAISILALVDQYLAYLNARGGQRLEQMADYLVMAAWLAYLKSALLLPRTAQDEPSADELAQRLQQRLRLLDAMRDAGARLMARDQIGRDVFRRGAPEGIARDRHVSWSAGLYDILASYGAVRARAEPPLHQVIRRPVVTLDAALRRIEALIGSAADWTVISAFLPPGGNLQHRRSALASMIVATLELARRGRIEMRQEAAFGPIAIRAA